MVAIVPLQKEVHAQVKINDRNMEHVQNQHIVPVIFHEFARVATEYPIVFVKNTDSGRFQPVCVLGIKPSENNFVKNQQWVSGYVPASVRQAPLCLVPEPGNENNFLIGINETSSRISLEQGEALFNNNGDESDYLKARKETLVELFEKEQVSQQLTQMFADMGLFVEQEIKFNLDGENLAINGVFIIDEDKLNSLPDDEFLQLRKRGVLPAIYAHLISMHQLDRVASFKAS